MQKVAAYALFSPTLSDLQCEDRFLEVGQIFEKWRQQKGVISFANELTTISLKDGRIAKIKSKEFIQDKTQAIDHYLVEPVSGGTLETKFSFALANNRVIVHTEISLASNEFEIAPMQIDIRCPSFIKTIVSAFNDWNLGSTPICDSPINFTGSNDAAKLCRIIWQKERNLPLIAISTRANETLTDTFPDEIASDMTGLALVVKLDDQCAWELTRLNQKEWSCYDGAIRIYWPPRAPEDDSRRHPTWTWDRLLSEGLSREDAAYRIKTQLRRKLLRLSTVAIREPDEFLAIRDEHENAEIVAARKLLSDKQDWRGLADSYSIENDTLKTDLAETRHRLKLLEEQLAFLQSNTQTIDLSTTADYESDNLKTVEDAIQKARERYSDTLHFGEDVQKGLRTIAKNAGPPEKILQYLEQLSILATLKAANTIGQDVVTWLNNRKIVASKESQTIKNDKKERQARTWSDGAGKKRFFDLHLKPTESTSPDRCVRIYFDFAEDKVVIGWIGRHPE